jgi:hypothetical protein
VVVELIDAGGYDALLGGGDGGMAEHGVGQHGRRLDSQPAAHVLRPRRIPASPPPPFSGASTPCTLGGEGLALLLSAAVLTPPPPKHLGRGRAAARQQHADFTLSRRERARAHQGVLTPASLVFVMLPLLSIDSRVH